MEHLNEYLGNNAEIDKNPLSNWTMFGTPGLVTVLVQSTELGLADVDIFTHFIAQRRAGCNLPVLDAAGAESQQTRAFISSCYVELQRRLSNVDHQVHSTDTIIQ